MMLSTRRYEIAEEVEEWLGKHKLREGVLGTVFNVVYALAALGYLCDKPDRAPVSEEDERRQG